MKATAPAQPDTSAATLWRCGGRQCGAGECEHEEGELHRRASGPAPRYAPPLVHDVLRSTGSPLPGPVRSALEERLSADFADVRIHTDARAGESAQAVAAHAYTVGRHVVFAAGRYAPDTAAGRRLLLHELTHAAQSRHDRTPSGPLRVSSPDEPAEQHAETVASSTTSARCGSLPAGAATLHRAVRDPATPHRLHTGLLPYREATEYARCMTIMNDREHCDQEVLGRSPLRHTPASASTSTPTPQTCVPDRPLTWADFSGTPPAGTAFSALTHFTFGPRTSGGRDWIVATFVGASSWVRPRAAAPTDRSRNGCAPRVADCQTFFDGLGPGQTGWRSLGPTTGCAASPQPDTTLQATSRPQCETVLGTECDRVAVLESARLLRHEQLHFDLACVMAAKGNAALAATPAPSTQTILGAVGTKANAQTRAYDDDSRHGCDPGGQAAWETAVSQGLPTITVP